MAISLAVKYRPKKFDEVCEQTAIKVVLQQLISSGKVISCLLFCGGAGTGKTTTARILADELNGGSCKPIELDAASHNSTDDIKNIIEQAQTKSLEGKLKVFIIDECHALSNQAWQTFLKTLEEPPEGVVFILCTTNPEKIPATILSRVQRYDFHKISYQGIYDRLIYILNQENKDGMNYTWEEEAISYIAKMSNGGMRDAITTLDKCLAYSYQLKMANIEKALGITGYDEMFSLLKAFQSKDTNSIISLINKIHMQGIDLKQYMKQFMEFVLDVCKYMITKNFMYIQIPNTYKTQLDSVMSIPNDLLDTLVTLNSNLKYETQPKALIESTLLLEINK